MARAATTTDVFNAVAEEKRREILDSLREGEASVGELVERLEMDQPQVSKHLKVLREVDLVEFRTEGRSRVYRVRGESLRPVLDWIGDYEALWNDRYDRLGDYLVELQKEE